MINFTLVLEILTLEDSYNAGIRRMRFNQLHKFLPWISDSIDDNEVHSPVMSDEARFHLSGFVKKKKFPLLGKRKCPPTTSEIMTRSKGYSVVCGIVFRNY